MYGMVNFYKSLFSESETMIFGCGNNISKQVCEDAPQILCCPTPLNDLSEAKEIHIAFSYIFWKTGE